MRLRNSDDQTLLRHLARYRILSRWPLQPHTIKGLLTDINFIPTVKYRVRTFHNIFVQRVIQACYERWVPGEVKW